MKYIKNKDGKFAGSVGDGRDNVPKPAVKHGLFFEHDSGARDLSGVAAMLEAEKAERARLSEDYGLDSGFFSEADEADEDDEDDEADEASRMSEGFESEDGVDVYDQDGQPVDLNVLQEQFRAAEKKSNELRDQYNSEYNAGKWTTNRPLAGRAENAHSEMIDADQAYKAAARAEEQGMVKKFYRTLDTDSKDLWAKRIQDEQDISFEEAREMVGDDNDGGGTKTEMLLNQYAIVRRNCARVDSFKLEEALMDPALTDDSTRRAFAMDARDEDLLRRLEERAADGDSSIRSGLSFNDSWVHYSSW